MRTLLITKGRLFPPWEYDATGAVTSIYLLTLPLVDIVVWGTLATTLRCTAGTDWAFVVPALSQGTCLRAFVYTPPGPSRTVCVCVCLFLFFLMFVWRLCARVSPSPPSPPPPHPLGTLCPSVYNVLTAWNSEFLHGAAVTPTGSHQLGSQVLARIALSDDCWGGRVESPCAQQTWG